VPAKVLEPAFAQLERAGYLRHASGAWALTGSGTAEFEKLATAWKGWLTERLDDWGTGPELDAAIGRVAARLLDQSTDDNARGRHALT
jgi:hypothetical protein